MAYGGVLGEKDVSVAESALDHINTLTQRESEKRGEKKGSRDLGSHAGMLKGC